MDWADEIEIKIADEYGNHGAVLAADADGMIAAALRKAKADGIREAAELGLTLPKSEGGAFADGYRYAIGTYQDAMLRRASQIEKGQ